METQLLKNHLKKGLVVLIVLMTAYGCQKDEIQIEPENNESIKTQKLFDKSDFGNLIAYDYTVDVSQPAKLYSDELGSFYYEFPVQFTSSFNPDALNKLQKEGGYYTKYNVLAIETGADVFEFYAVKFYQHIDITDANLIDSDVSFSNLENFTGNFQLINKEKQLVLSKKLIKGVTTDVMAFKKKRDTETSVFNRSAQNCETRPIEMYTDWYKVSNVGGQMTLEYSHESFDGYGYEEVCTSSSSSGALPYVNPSGSNSEGFYKKRNSGGASEDDAIILIRDEVEDEIINELTGKANCAYDNLLKTGVRNPHNLITQLFIEFGNGNIGNNDLTFRMVTDLPIGVGGNTRLKSDGNFEILVNANLMDQLSSIEVAAILVHEIAHAFLGKRYNNSFSSFKDLYSQYINPKGLANYSHNIMNDKFIIRMATVLQNYDNQLFSKFEDYQILASQGVFNLTTSQKMALSLIKTKARKNEKNCKD